MDGVLVVDKPDGPTSHDVVSKVRRALNVDKVGHTGTLDPMATGVLPLVLGRGTKLARYLTGGDKTYLATVHLGISTRTLDAEGEVVSERPVDVTLEQVQAALAELTGAIDQVPPMYSAKKIDGKKLYELARKGIEVEREAKKVTVHFINLHSFTTPEIVFEVKCSAGTYVRVLAHDVGEKLGCGAYLKALRRTHAGPFAIDQAVILDEVVANPAEALNRVLPLTHALMQLPRINVSADVGRMIVSGHQLSVADLRVVDTPEFDLDQALALGVDGGDVIAVVRTQLASSELSCSRRDRRALKTERVLSARF